MRISDWSSDVCSSDLFVGTDVSDTITVDFQALATGFSAFGAATLGVNLSVGTATAAANAMTAIDAAPHAISEARATAASLIPRFAFRGQPTATSPQTIAAA